MADNAFMGYGLPPDVWNAFAGMGRTQRDAPVRNAWGPMPPPPMPEGPLTERQDAAAWAEREYGKVGRAAANVAFAEPSSLVPQPGGSGDWKKDALDVANLAMLVMPGGAKVGGPRGRDPAMWHGLSLVKLPRPVSEMSSGRLMTERPMPERLVSPEDLQGGVLLPAMGDRSAIGGSLTHSGGGQPLQNPVPLQGGHGYMAENAPSGHLWASNKGVISTMANRAMKIAETEKAPVYTPYTAMGERSVDFSHHMSDTLADLTHNAKLSKQSVTAFDNAMRADMKDFGPTADWPGVQSKNLNEYLVSAPGAVRNKFAKVMDTAQMQAAGFPSVAEARFAVTDPRLLDVPTGASGLSIGRLDPSKTAPAAHRTYDTAIGGEYVGGFGRSVPKEVMYPDMMEAYKQQGYEPRQFDYLMGRGKSPTYQRADQKWLDNIMKYLQETPSR